MFAQPISKPQYAPPAAPRVLQRKCAMGASNDPLEREADRMAEHAPADRTQADFGRVPLSAPRLVPPEGERPAEVLGSMDRPCDAVARQGMGGQSAPDRPVPLKVFPHGDVIGRGLGRPIPAHAVIDPRGCARHSAPAFTKDGQTHFSSPYPSLRIAAHEATHVLQQLGATRDMGVGIEGQAAAVESRISCGVDAARLLGNRGGAPGFGPLNYTYFDEAEQFPGNWNAKMNLRVSDDGQMAVGGSALGHDFWATNAKVEESNAILAGLGHKGSAIRLQLQPDTMSGAAPDGTGPRLLSKVLPRNVFQKKGTKLTLWADCGAAARDVMGAGEGSRFRSGKAKGVYYAPEKPGQTFHEQHKASGLHGKSPITMRIRTIK